VKTVHDARFVSSLGPHLVAYLEVMRAVGRRYERVETILRGLDRFVAREPAGEVLLTHDLLGRWLASTPQLAPGTLRAHASAARGFCRYLSRFEPRTAIPDRSLAPARLPEFRPHVFSPAEMRDLLAAAGRLPSRGWPDAPRTIRTLILVLYATGLRIGEALRLSIRDVDPENGTLFVAQTKFFKSRWVPCSASLGIELRAYLAARTAALGPARPDDPFFIGSRGTALRYSHVARLFKRLVRETGIDAATTRQGGVRLHSLRHTFAQHCLLRWYRDGADVGAKLPLLATYLGHGSVLATHVYLRATPELLGAASERFEIAYGSLVALPEEFDHAVR
jgi:integrase/recombinase XerD